MPRASWLPPSDSDLLGEIARADEDSRHERLQRFRFILSEFGPSAHMLLVGGIPAMFAIIELKRLFIDGSFLATILVAQAFAEHSLGAQFGLAGEVRIGNAGFKRLVEESVARRWVSEAIGARLDQLREMRNPYTHPKPGSPKRYEARLRSSGGYDPEKLAEDDAHEAIRIIVDWMREVSPSWAPPREATPWPDGPSEDDE